MAKVFSITEGLENLGALKSGGQGSVYKGRRNGNQYSAIKILPTPIFSESGSDKNFVAFQNEVQKLERVNRPPHPNVVKMLGWGITDSGSFPYIEMAFIDGPDLGELLHPPHASVFTIAEAVNVAAQLSLALAHCHRQQVKHGDIKSNNIKFDQQTQKYVLLDFGLSALSDEQRRTSLRHAGAIEFMAPEQHDGQLLFETDVYSFGVVMFELLAGRVPFVLASNTEAARNMVRLAHIEQNPPSLLELRRAAVQQSQWSPQQQLQEQQLPDWLQQMVYRCLAKQPAARFAHGMELQAYISRQQLQQQCQPVQPSRPGQPAADQQFLANEHRRLQQQVATLQQHVNEYRQMLSGREADIEELKQIISRLQREQAAAPAFATRRRRSFTDRLVVFAIIVSLLGIGGYAAYSYLKSRIPVAAYMNKAKKHMQEMKNAIADVGAALPTWESNTADNKQKTKKQSPSQQPGATGREQAARQPAKPQQRETAIARQVSQPGTPSNHENNGEAPAALPGDDQVTTTQRPANTPLYTVGDKAFFYSGPDADTRRPAYILANDRAVLAALDDQNGFVYVVFVNDAGQTSKGWLRKTDLTRLY